MSLLPSYFLETAGLTQFVALVSLSFFVVRGHDKIPIQPFLLLDSPDQVRLKWFVSLAVFRDLPRCYRFQEIHKAFCSGLQLAIPLQNVHYLWTMTVAGTLSSTNCFLSFISASSCRAYHLILPYQCVPRRNHSKVACLLHWRSMPMDRNLWTLCISL